MITETLKTRTPVAVAAAAVLLLIAAILAPTPAKAQTGNVVTFGDSFTASPDQWLNGFGGSSAPESYPRAGGCLQSPYNWPRQLAAVTGLDVDDWSCTAETTEAMLLRIDEAIDAGAIAPTTQAVIFSVGGNDFDPLRAGEGAPLSSGDAMTERYSENMQEAAEKVRAVAPDAQLIVSGYPQVTNGHALCFIHVIPNRPLGIPAPGTFAEELIRDLQFHGAQAAGMDFVDNYELTAGHDTCSTDDARRYVAGILDVTSPAYEMIMHPTGLGHSAIAANNAEALGFPGVAPELPDWVESSNLSSALSSMSMSSGSSGSSGAHGSSEPSEAGGDILANEPEELGTASEPSELAESLE